MEKQLAIVGAGLSGLLACKYALQKGFDPVVFESDEVIGGVWTQTFESTKLQSPKSGYEFADFPWPSSVEEAIPRGDQVLEYLVSYATHFGLFPYIKFNSQVTGIAYVGGESAQEMEAWDLWGGTGKPFGSSGKWRIQVQDTKAQVAQEYEAEFVILCIGQFSGLPNIPEFSPNKGPEVFQGKVLHSMDYGIMDNLNAANLIAGKRVAVIGSNKSAIDIAMECATINGPGYPCTMIQRRVQWYFPFDLVAECMAFFFTRFKDVLFHRPGEPFWLGLLTTMLSPVNWMASKLTESYLRIRFPLKKYDMIPEESFIETFDACRVLVLPEGFYDKADEGSLILKRSKSFSFCKEGLLLKGEAQSLKTDLVIFATGYKGDEKLSNIFQSQRLRDLMMGSPLSIPNLYRQVIHPRIPHLAVIGYGEILSNVMGNELKCQWLVQLLDSKFQLPTIREMEKDVQVWDKYYKEATGTNFRRFCTTTGTSWYFDQLCQDMGANHRRKTGLLAHLFSPYLPADYAGLADN